MESTYAKNTPEGGGGGVHGRHIRAGESRDVNTGTLWCAALLSLLLQHVFLLKASRLRRTNSMMSAKRIRYTGVAR
jgi:hypothetical protein